MKKIPNKNVKLVNECLQKYNIRPSCTDTGTMFSCCTRWHTDNKVDAICTELSREQLSSMLREVNKELEGTHYTCCVMVISDGDPFSTYDIIIGDMRNLFAKVFTQDALDLVKGLLNDPISDYIENNLDTDKLLDIKL